MRRYISDGRGFTLTEVMFVAVISVIVIGTILSAWIFTHKAWTIEGERTRLRVDMTKGMETVQDDIRLSSATYIVVYPADSVSGAYTAISMPVADTDAAGFYTLDAGGAIEWDRTVIYHIFTDDDGNKTLRRTVYDPRDNTMSDTDRYNQLAAVVSAGTGGVGSTTDTEFLENLDTFEVAPLPLTIDFYEDSEDPVRMGKVIFGWARMDAGDHTVRFEVTGKNDDSSGYAFGLDYLRIEPCGSRREAEYYNSSFAPSGALSSNGKTVNRVYDNTWSNDNYLEYQATAEDDYITITDYYDLWRESTFSDSSRNNTMFYEEEVRVKIELPEDRETGKEQIRWYASEQSGDTQQDGRDGYANPGAPTSAPSEPLVIRTVIKNAFIDMDADAGEKADLVRVKFKSSSSDALKIAKAYITRRDPIVADDSNPEYYNGKVNLDPSGRDIDEYHMHQQLFFEDTSTGDMLEGVTIEAGEEAWTVWTAFPLIVRDSDSTDLDYLVTYYADDVSDSSCKYWQGTSYNTCYITGADYSTTELGRAAGTPVWGSDYTIRYFSDDICAVSDIDTWENEGTVESNIFDTAEASPVYNQIKWSEDRPAGTNIIMKTRSSEDQFMENATDWSLITGSGVNPHSLSISSDRYVQFMAQISTDPFWECSAGTLAYADYVDEQRNLAGAPYTFPSRSGEYLVTGLYSAWIDDVEIDWPGEDRTCVLSGYIARKDDYGQVKVKVDGKDIFRVYRVDLEVSADFQDRTLEEASSVELEPRNTGR